MRRARQLRIGLRFHAVAAAGALLLAGCTPAADRGGSRTSGDALALAQPPPLESQQTVRSELPSPVNPLASVARRFTWEDVTLPEYPEYLARLRRAGCPDETVRRIVVNDVNRYFDQRRLQTAIAHDLEWWRVEPSIMTLQALQNIGRAWEDDRRALLEKLAGMETALAEHHEYAPWHTVPLTGEVLGKLPPARHEEVQRICARALEQQTAHDADQVQDDTALEVAQAKLRTWTRTELERVLQPHELQEYLLRYSHNATQLRTDLRGLNPTADEFRKAFAALDPVMHQLQVELGSVAMLSPRQRERHEARCLKAIRDALSPARFAAFMATRGPEVVPAIAGTP